MHCVSAYEGDIVIMGSAPSYALASFEATNILLSFKDIWFVDNFPAV